MSDLTDWIGAIGTGLGAIGTAGALLLGVRVYKRQEEDQRRAQAAAVTVGHQQDRVLVTNGGWQDQYRYFIRNDSPLPIYHVALYAGPVDERSTKLREVLAPRESASFVLPTSDFMTFGKFVDTAGIAWKRDGSGRLHEIANNDGAPWPTD